MSESSRIPALLNADGSLNDAGAALVKFVTSTIRRQRSEETFERYASDEYRDWWAAVIKSPPLMTVEQYIAKGYSDPSRKLGLLWVHYLGSLDPTQRARAEIGAPDQPAPTKESTMSEAKPLRLIESVDDLPRWIAEQATQESGHVTLQKAMATPRDWQRYAHQENMNHVKSVLDRLVKPNGQADWSAVRSPEDHAMLINYLKAGK